MPGYISEVDYFGTSDSEFVEIVVPEGTDVSGYSLVFYQADGTIYNTTSLGAYADTIAGQDVYVVDQSTPNFDSVGDEMGTFYPDDAIALVDDNGNVLQFLSWEGNTITATEGPANGMTSTNAGFANESLQSDDGGNSYYAQSDPNKGSIPACYAPGTRIDTPSGPCNVEQLSVGDQVWTADHGAQIIRWIWDSEEPVEDKDKGGYPVLIKAGALGGQLPAFDLIVSAQHRILVGCSGQLESAFKDEAFVPAKALLSLPGIRQLRGKTTMRWIHFSCDRHEVVRANECLSESLFLGPMVVRDLSRVKRYMLRRIYGANADQTGLNGPLARSCMTVGKAQSCLRNARQARKLIDQPKRAAPFRLTSGKCDARLSFP